MSYNTLPTDEPPFTFTEWVDAQDGLVLDYAPDSSVARTPEGERLKYRNPADYIVDLVVESDLATS